MTAKSKLIDPEVAAYRDRDLERCVMFFSDDVIVTDFEGTVLVRGIDELRNYYGPALSRQSGTDGTDSLSDRVGVLRRGS